MEQHETSLPRYQQARIHGQQAHKQAEGGIKGSGEQSAATQQRQVFVAKGREGGKAATCAKVIKTKQKAAR